MVGRFLETVCNCLRVALGCLMASLASPVRLQVLSCSTGIIPTFLWTEELATFIFGWMSAFFNVPRLIVGTLTSNEFGGTGTAQVIATLNPFSGPFY